MVSSNETQCLGFFILLFFAGLILRELFHIFPGVIENVMFSLLSLIRLLSKNSLLHADEQILCTEIVENILSQGQRYLTKTSLGHMLTLLTVSVVLCKLHKNTDNRVAG